MLKNISSVISPDLLWLLASMGHGDFLRWASFLTADVGRKDP
jgi:L-fucose mutarotase/ribose pyranase (RbsD/FucU family)